MCNLSHSILTFFWYLWNFFEFEFFEYFRHISLFTSVRCHSLLIIKSCWKSVLFWNFVKNISVIIELNFKAYRTLFTVVNNWEVIKVKNYWKKCWNILKTYTNLKLWKFNYIFASSFATQIVFPRFSYSRKHFLCRFCESQFTSSCFPRFSRGSCVFCELNFFPIVVFIFFVVFEFNFLRKCWRPRSVYFHNTKAFEIQHRKISICRELVGWK